MDQKEQLIADMLDRQAGSVVNEIVSDKKTDRLTSIKSATLEDFIEMVSSLVSKILIDDNVEFKPDEGLRVIYDSTETLNNPIITYTVIERKRSQMGEMKPRHRESGMLEQTNSSNESRSGSVYGQRQDCLIQFNIMASEYTLANKVMNSLEDILYSYTGYLKKNGVAEIIFLKHYTDQTYDIYRQKFSVRNLVYSVSIEKLFIIFDTIIDDVTIS